ncbi:HMG box protein [Paramyrothecium foliicola]|nr:HMG box protein [Paramyrothecium foliicola]
MPFHSVVPLNTFIRPALNSLRTVALDTIGESPALRLELLVRLDLHAVLGDDSQGVGVHAPSVAVEEDLHALSDDVDGLLTRELLGGLLIRGIAAEDGLGQHGAEAGGETGRGVGGTEQVRGGEEGLAGVVEAGDKQVVPQGVELGSAVVEHLGEVAVEVGGAETGRVWGGVGLGEVEVGEVAVEVLHVGDVAAEANHGGVLERTQALNVREAGERAVGGCFEAGMGQPSTSSLMETLAMWCTSGGGAAGKHVGMLRTKVIGGHDNAVLVLDGYHGRAGDNGLLGVLLGAIVVHEGGVVGAVDVISRLVGRTVSVVLDWAPLEEAIWVYSHDPRPADGDPCLSVERVEEDGGEGASMLVREGKLASWAEESYAEAGWQSDRTCDGGRNVTRRPDLVKLVVMELHTPAIEASNSTELARLKLSGPILAMFTSTTRAVASRVLAGLPRAASRPLVLRPAPIAQRSFILSSWTSKQSSASSSADATTEKAKKPRAKKASTKSDDAAKKPKKAAAEKKKKKPAAKPLTPEQKQKLRIRQLKEWALLDEPSQLPQHIWTVYVAANFPKDPSVHATQVMKDLAADFQRLPESEKEELRATAAANGKANLQTRKDWIESFPPEVIFLAQSARKRLAKETSTGTRTRRYAQLHDQRVPKPAVGPYALFIQSRFNKTDGQSAADAIQDLARTWNGLSEEEKQPFINLSHGESKRVSELRAELKEKAKAYWAEHSTVTPSRVKSEIGALL